MPSCTGAVRTNAPVRPTRAPTRWSAAPRSIAQAQRAHADARSTSRSPSIEPRAGAGRGSRPRAAYVVGTFDTKARELLFLPTA